MDWGAYIGLPYEGMNCWQLIRKVYSEALYIELGDEKETTANIQDSWYSVQPGSEQIYDVLVFDGEAKHVGLVIEPGRFIHNEHSGTNSCIESYRAPKWKDRIKRIYRNRLLAYSVA